MNKFYKILQIFNDDKIKKEFYAYFIFQLKNRCFAQSLKKIVFKEKYCREFDFQNEIEICKGKTVSYPEYLELFLEKHKKASESKLRLATETVELKNHLNWDEPISDDREDLFSIHRFSWLLLDFFESYNSEIYYQIILDWIQKMRPDKKCVGWDSYSISERLINWIFFLSLEKSYKENQDVLASIFNHVEILAENLEYRGGATNNHLIQNVRALYIAGVFLKQEEICKKATEILFFESNHMFTASGFLREGSSHYHILLTRTYLELLCIAISKNDQNFCKLLYDRIKAMHECASFLFEEGTLPLIGDVSPDFPPDFHLSIINLGKTLFISSHDVKHENTKVSGWASLFHENKRKHQIGNIITNPDKALGLINFRDSGYYRFENKAYSVLIYANPNGFVPSWSHGHADLGGFMLYWRGEPIFVDIGRSTYEKNSLGNYARSIRGHNSFSINGFEPCLVHGLNGYTNYMADEYLNRPPRVDINDAGHNPQLTIHLASYQRVFDSLTASRTFVFGEEKLIVEDKIMGVPRSCLLETFFHLDPKISVENKCTNSNLIKMKTTKNGKLSILFSAVDAEVNILKGKRGKTPAGWYFPRYGEAVPTHNIVLKQSSSLPLINKYEIAPM